MASGRRQDRRRHWAASSRDQLPDRVVAEVPADGAVGFSHQLGGAQNVRTSSSGPERARDDHAIEARRATGRPARRDASLALDLVLETAHDRRSRPLRGASIRAQRTPSYHARRVDDDLRAMSHQDSVSTATLSSQLQKHGFLRAFMPGVRPLRPDLRMAGRAFTLRYIPVREDLEMPGEFDNRTNKQRIAVESVGPGDVLVIDARGDTRAATLGNILATRIALRGAAAS
jgi:hypothetical protein